MRFALLLAVALAGCSVPGSDPGSDAQYPEEFLIVAHLPDEWELLPEDHEFFQAFASEFGMEENPDDIDAESMCEEESDDPCPEAGHAAFVWVPETDFLSFNVVAQFDDADEAEQALEDEGCDGAVAYRGGDTITIVTLDLAGEHASSLEDAAADMADAADLGHIC